MAGCVTEPSTTLAVSSDIGTASSASRTPWTGQAFRSVHSIRVTPAVDTVWGSTFYRRRDRHNVTICYRGENLGNFLPEAGAGGPAQASHGGVLTATTPPPPPLQPTAPTLPGQKRRESGGEAAGCARLRPVSPTPPLAGPAPPSAATGAARPGTGTGTAEPPRPAASSGHGGPAHARRGLLPPSRPLRVPAGRYRPGPAAAPTCSAGSGVHERRCGALSLRGRRPSKRPLRLSPQTLCLVLPAGAI